MKTSIIYGAVLITALMAVSHVALAEVAAIKDESECPVAKVSNDKDLVTILSDLSTEQAAQYFQPTKNRFVFCMVKNPQAESEFAVETPIILKNASAYPVIIYNLYINGINGGALTVQNTSEILFQNLKADSLKAPILLQGKTTLLDSTISCDAAQTTPAITVTSSNNTFRKVNINECATGLDLIGGFNIFYEVAIRKTATDESQIGSLGISASGGRNTFYALMIQNYKVGALLSASGNRIFGLDVPEGTANALKTVDGKFVIPSVIAGFTTKNTIPASAPGEADKVEYIPVKDSIGVYFKFAGTLETSKVDGFSRGVVVLANKVNILRNFELGGTLGAVVIGHDPITNLAYQPVTVSKNNFSTADTIIYVDNGDKAAYRLLGVEWMAKHKSEADPTKADYMIGKILDQSNQSQFVELGTNELVLEENKLYYKLSYTRTCPVVSAKEVLTLISKSDSGAEQKKEIQIDEKYFICPLDTPLEKKVRVVSNTPTVSLMSEDMQLADFPNVITTPGQVGVIMDSGGLVDGTQVAGMAGGDAPALDVPNSPQSPAGGGSGNIPVESPDVGENSGGSNMVNGVTGLDGGVPTVAGGGAELAGGQGLMGSLTSGRGCSLNAHEAAPQHGTSVLLMIVAVNIIAAGLVRRRYNQR